MFNPQVFLYVNTNLKGFNDRIKKKKLFAWPVCYLTFSCLKEKYEY